MVDAVGEWDTSLRHCQDWDYVLRATEHAPVRGDQEVATFYRRHAAAQTSNVAATLHFETVVVDRYFQRHPELAGTRLERLARAQLLRVRASAGPWPATGPGRACACSPGRSRSIAPERWPLWPATGSGPAATRS